MSRRLILSFRFLSPWFHGRADEGAPEWPPSPLRAFQAMVAASGRSGALDASRRALEWLEQAPPPVVFAPDAVTAPAGYRLSVPHNALDVVARQWARGKDDNAAEHRAMKTVRPTHLPEDAAVHYVWPEPQEQEYATTLIDIARTVVALGWGQDLVVGNGVVADETQASALSGALMTWSPRADGGTRLRAPVAGTLNALEQRHEAFIVRTSLDDPTLRPAPALTAFHIAPYARADEQPACPVATFTLMCPHEDRFRAFDTAPHGMVVAGMLRHATRVASTKAGWAPERIAASVMGHGEGHEPRLLLIPVPSVEYRGGGSKLGAVRRVMLFSTDGRQDDARWAGRALAGSELIDEHTGEVMAVMTPAATQDRVFSHYLQAARTWSSVTPIVLPGHDDSGGMRAKLKNVRDAGEQRKLLDRLATRRDALVRKSLAQAGLSDDLVSSVRVETSPAGFQAGVEHASRYAVPRHLAQAPRTHVRLTWPRPVRGPLCIGRGRFSGLGLLVGTPE